MVRIPSEYQEVEWIERDVEGAIIVISTDDLNIAGCDVYAAFTVLGPSDGERGYIGGFSSISGGKSWEIYFPSLYKISGGFLNVEDSTITQLGVPG